jgi:hypothetical protein
LLFFGVGLVLEGFGLISGRRFSDGAKERRLFLITGILVIILALVKLTGVMP